MCAQFLPTLYAIVVCGAMSSEADGLLLDADALAPGPASRPSFARTAARAGFGFGVLAVAALAVLERAGGPAARGGAAGAASGAVSAATRSAEPDPESMPELAFRILNEYTSARGASPPAKHYPWVEAWHLAEPYRNSVLEVAADSLNAGDDAESLDYGWEIAGPLHDRFGQDTSASPSDDDDARYDDDAAVVKSLVGRSSTMAFGAPGKYRIAVAELAGGGGPRRATSRYVWCKYVRRELRGLTDEDRVAFFDAAEVIFKVGCAEGKATYGRKFDCISTFTRLHADLAGDPYCDHAHDGYGFLNQHVGLALWFEHALQSVNNLVALPYWDYTIDEHAVLSAEPGTVDLNVWWHSELWSDDWFGPACPRDHIVDSGRWAYISVEQQAWNVSMWTNSYGMLRAPWNNNRAPYVTRSNTTYGFVLTDLPGCHTHYEQLQLSKFSDFGSKIMYAPHGTTHIAIGGVFNANWHTKLFELEYDMVVAPSWTIIGFAIQKNMFRAGFLACPAYCALDTPMSECKCTCPHEDENVLSGYYLEVLDQIMEGRMDYLQDRFGNDISTSIYRMLCNNGTDLAPVMGDSLESASPGDISFWPTHPTVDRLFQWRRLNGMTNDWIDNDSWSVQGVDVGYCLGHNLHDLLPYTNLFEHDAGPYSNAQMWNLTDPLNTHSPYVYDSFEWAHCVDEGYSSDLLERVGLPDGNERWRVLPQPEWPQTRRRRRA